MRSNGSCDPSIEMVGGSGRCSFTQKTLGAAEVDVLDGQVPMGVEDLEAMLLFALIGLLIGEELLEQRLFVEAVIGGGGVLEDDGDAVVPAAVFGGVIARRDSAYFEQPTEFNFFLQQWVMVLLEQRDELLSVSPFHLVVVLDDEGFVLSVGLRRSQGGME